MSLRRRIAAAATVAVAAVALVYAPTSYLYTSAKLYGVIHQQLKTLVAPYLTARPATGQTTTTTPSQPSQTGGEGTCDVPQPAGGERPPALGGAIGYFQSVCPNGKVIAFDGGKPQLPVPERAFQVARTLTGAYFFSMEVNRVDYEIYVVPDVPDKKAIEVALPLNAVDSTLQGLTVALIVLTAGAVVMAGVVGALIADAALRPIVRFTRETEQVTSELQRPRRLEEHGAVELRRLAASFNHTLGALERSVEAQKHLIADASHELRTPMAALRSNIQIFLDAERLPEEERHDLQEAIMAELDDLTQLVADVLELARGTPLGEHVEQIELGTVVQEAIDRTERRAGQIRFVTDIEPTMIENSPERVGRAVLNVIDNARKWSPPEGEIEVTLRNAVLTVRDHGPGFKEADLGHVFDRFYRSDEARRMPGSGLGLAIVKQAAEAYGGFVSAGNHPEGGAVVRVSFGPPGIRVPKPPSVTGIAPVDA